MNSLKCYGKHTNNHRKIKLICTCGRSIDLIESDKAYYTRNKISVYEGKFTRTITIECRCGKSIEYVNHANREVHQTFAPRAEFYENCYRIVFRDDIKALNINIPGRMPLKDIDGEIKYMFINILDEEKAVV